MVLSHLFLLLCLLLLFVGSWVQIFFLVFWKEKKKKKNKKQKSPLFRCEVGFLLCVCLVLISVSDVVPVVFVLAEWFVVSFYRKKLQTSCSKGASFALSIEAKMSLFFLAQV